MLPGNAGSLIPPMRPTLQGCPPMRPTPSFVVVLATCRHAGT